MVHQHFNAAGRVLYTFARGARLASRPSTPAGLRASAFGGRASEPALQLGDPGLESRNLLVSQLGGDREVYYSVVKFRCRLVEFRRGARRRVSGAASARSLGVGHSALKQWRAAHGGLLASMARTVMR